MVKHDGVAGIILAAGESRRFGAPKQLAVLDGRLLLEHVLELAAGSELDPVVAVVPVWLTRPAALSDPRLHWVRNPHPERGMSHSLRLGLAAIPPEAGAAVILLGDQPRVGVPQIAALVAARGERPLIATRSGDHLGPPVLVERSHFTLAQEARGDAGLREILAARPELVAAVDTVRPIADIDTPDDLATLDGG